MVFWSVLCSMIGLGFAAEAMGLFAHAINTALAALFLLIGAALDPATRPLGPQTKHRFRAIGFAAAILGLLFIPVSPTLRFFAAALWFWGLDSIALARTNRHSHAAALAVGCLLFGLYQFCAANSLLAWYGIQDVSRELSGIWNTGPAGKPPQHPLSLGPTFSGMGVLVLALGICIGGFWISKRRRLLPGIMALVAVCILYRTYLGIFAQIPLGMAEDPPALVAEPAGWQKAVGDFLGLTFPVAKDGEAATGARAGKPPVAPDASASKRMVGHAHPTGLAPGAQAEPSIARLLFQMALRLIYPLHVPLLLPLLLALPLGLYLRLISAELRPRRPTASRTGIIVVIGIASLAVWALTNRPARSDGSAQRTLRSARLNVALYEKGFLNWGVPNHDRYGSRSAGMFGNLPLLVERMGGQADRIEEITPATLSERDILVIINQKDPLPGESLHLIDRFVQTGGALLVLGDHTFWKSEHRVLCNEPLSASHIRLRFDSADYFIGGWLHSLAFWAHPITADLDDAANEAGSVVGASLEISYPAVPLVVGRYGYSDPGEKERKALGYLGNLDFDPDEMLGDIVLVAAENVGRGRVVVAGDTSGFVNAIQTQTWPYVQRVFSWLASGGRAAIPKWRDLLGITLMIALGAAVLGFVPAGRAVLPGAAAALLVCGWASHRIVANAARPGPLTGNVAVVDLSHVGLHSIEGWRDNGVSGLYLNLMREGFFAIGMRDFDEEQLRASKLFITVAPTRPYSTREVDTLRGFMEDGGTVLLCAGWEERAGAMSLLDGVGLRLVHRPLGRASTYVPGTSVQPMFWSAWPVLGGEETLVTLRGDPVIVRKAVGDGRIVVVGDSEFLLNKNLEGENGAIMQSVRFFGWLLEHVMEREAP